MQEPNGYSLLLNETWVGNTLERLKLRADSRFSPTAIERRRYFVTTYTIGWMQA